MSGVVEKKRRVIARVAVDRAIRLQAVPDPVPSALPAPAKDLACSRCGAVVCEGSRAKLFAGMVLTCNSCGERVRG